MKYLAKSQNNKMIQLGEDIKKGKWYYISEEIAKVIDILKIGDTVTALSEPRGGALHVTFLAQGEVPPPAELVKKAEAIVATQTPKPSAPYQSTYKKPGSDMTKEEWNDKERRDFKGRCIVYASSILKDAGFTFSTKIGDDTYYKVLFEVADKLREYIYS